MSNLEEDDFSEAFYSQNPEIGCDTIFDPVTRYLIRDYWNDPTKERLEILTDKTHQEELTTYAENVLKNSQIKLNEYRDPIPVGPLNLRVFTGLIPRVEISRCLVENLYDDAKKYNAARKIAQQAYEQAGPENLSYIRAPFLEDSDNDNEGKPCMFDNSEMIKKPTKEEIEEIYDTLARDPNRKRKE